MRALLSADAMGRADAAAIDSGTPAAALMDRAGRAVADVAIRVAGGRYGKKATVVCGKGNNGGDGAVVARVLAREGMAVRCFLLFDPAEARGPAAEHLTGMVAAGVRAEGWGPGAVAAVRASDVVVDAIFGTGTKGAPHGIAAEAITVLDDRRLPIVAVDIPSGVDPSTGAVEGIAVHARTTVALGAQKTGTALPPGTLRAGSVVVRDIGIGFDGGEPAINLLEERDVGRRLPVRPPDAHKKGFRTVAVLAGSDAMRGAPLLTARGAMRSGAGYVTLGTTATVKDVAATSLPELLVRAVGSEGVIGPEALDHFADVLDEADAVAVGPGIGTGAPQRALVERLLREFQGYLVLDADALNVLSEDVEPLSRREHPLALTPHPAELGRLLGIDTREVVGDRLAAAVAAAERFPAAVVLAKGLRTVVAHDEGRRAWVVAAGSAALASAGTGDVLAGVVATLGPGDDVPGAALAASVHG
ncbi:MAG TPA: NAD(P)H-hydrate dehydratase, partial [Actinomycetota bacterium]|nr:NAD(P)H-hydrate dehydratase [Actinomycetota bacterium]